jgi:hypothetical protein
MTKVAPGSTVLEDGLIRMTGSTTAADQGKKAGAYGDAWTARAKSNKIRIKSMTARETLFMADSLLFEARLFSRCLWLQVATHIGPLQSG